ncbi:MULTISPECIES: threonine synthase [Pectobacterium]|uniref:Threonine synthase n=3 Tax=Pectobacterium TaxID=122277 RepID=A0AA93APW3_9GAMM|nr:MULTISPECIES: threonine synthase [Pectobacterium]MDQ5892195.1 threonine synthase [Pseudomonadota bacterium]KAA3669187.1 threonine synthase [Pectobacterium carotovorum subsp. carotovorum]KFX01564.1 threonine synthase [Pectobacterium carotovorum subsp. carotovorum]KHT24187.1 threonine synthase [Pectobacterium carotovorum subsp. carotovorum]KHT30818.1 threonine synthase [Pectobacterium carotovorum subsp. carotovorum]
MKLYNLKDHNEQVSFAQAIKQGLGSQQGLFFPLELPEFERTEIDALLDLDFVTRSSRILSAYIGDEIATETVFERVKAAFAFPAPVAPVAEDIAALELFHGPTLAFKDFGGRFMAQMLTEVSGDEKITILTATSGDTGAAVAHAFYGLENVRVVILYPQGKISPLQEKLFCTLGGNIHTIAIDSDFDACQALVKKAFDDEELKKAIGLNSANSINISRLLAQICYYFEAVAQLPQEARNQLVVSVPSGNFGDLTAGLLAKSLGLPIKRFIAATNANDTVPRFLSNGNWEPHKTVATLSNAMDVSQPNNWPRVEELFRRKNWQLKTLGFGAVSDETTKETMHELDALGYLSEPHAAIAYRLLRDQLQAGEFGLFLGTAHPAKFKESVEDILGKELDLPEALAERADLDLLSHNFPDDFAKLREFLMSLPE